MLPKKIELTSLDLIEICISKKILIIFLTAVIGTFFCIIHVKLTPYKSKDIIRIYPASFIEVSQVVDDINRLQNIKKLFEYNMFADLNLNTQSVDDYSKSFYSGYTSPTKIVYEFSDLIKKKSLNNNHFKIIRATPIKHTFFKDHIDYFEFVFSFNDSIKNKSEIIKIYNDTKKNIKEKYILILKELKTELQKLDNQSILKEIKKIDDLIAIKNTKLEKEEDKNYIIVNNINLDKKLNTLNNNEGINFNTPLYILKERKKILELELNKNKIYTLDIEKLINNINKEDFEFVTLDILDDSTDELKKTNFTYYIIYFVLALIISMIYVLAIFLYNNKKKLLN
jgi:hypothetical protein